ncbi:MAG: DNA-3-methyladenine glycosylase [Solirubrobacteraceae bacterium MAG38_C4-C5]|nr:DNA-3-methyladenine glycosylase [Candidatus Siliceabacter maunaloa]
MTLDDTLALPVVEAARALVGFTVVHEGVAGVIVETEAYHQREPACHAHVGATARTHILFGPPGTAYVYRSYGIHALLNVVVEPRGVGAAVLIRALEPVDGLEAMRSLRGCEDIEALCSGPGKLTQALRIGLARNGTHLRDGPIVLLPPEGSPPALVASPRIGITKAADLPWRFSAHGSRYVSKPWPPGLEAPRPTRARSVQL